MAVSKIEMGLINRKDETLGEPIRKSQRVKSDLVMINYFFGRQFFILLINSDSSTYGITNLYLALVMAT